MEQDKLQIEKIKVLEHQILKLEHENIQIKEELERFKERDIRLNRYDDMANKLLVFEEIWKGQKRYLLIPIYSIIYIKADGKYKNIFLEKEVCFQNIDPKNRPEKNYIIVRKSWEELIEQGFNTLRRFIKINKSLLINFQFIESFNTDTQTVKLKTKSNCNSLKLTSSGKKELQSVIKTFCSLEKKIYRPIIEQIK